MTRIIIIHENNKIEEVVEGELINKDLSGIGEWQGATSDNIKAGADYWLESHDEDPFGNPSDYWIIKENPVDAPSNPRTGKFWDDETESSVFRILFETYLGVTIVYDKR